MQTPAPFDYERATSVEGAIASLAEHGPEARLIAGGHSLLPMMKLRLANPEYLIDINDLELSYIEERMTEVRIGALTRVHRQRVLEQFPPGAEERDRGAGIGCGHVYAAVVGIPQHHVDQPLLEQVQCGHGGRTGHRVAAEGAAVRARVPVHQLG